MVTCPYYGKKISYHAHLVMSATRGVATKTGSVPLMYGREGPGHTHNSTILCLPLSMKCLLTTESLQTVQLKPHSLNNTKIPHNAVNTSPHHHPHIGTTQPAWVDQHHLHTITNLSHTHSLSSSIEVTATPPTSSRSSD